MQAESFHSAYLLPLQSIYRDASFETGVTVGETYMDGRMRGDVVLNCVPGIVLIIIIIELRCLVCCHIHGRSVEQKYSLRAETLEMRSSSV